MTGRERREIVEGAERKAATWLDMGLATPSTLRVAISSVGDPPYEERHHLFEAVGMRRSLRTFEREEDDE